MYETIKTFEEFGITAVHIEDQVERKRCGHLDNKELISTDEMVKKLKNVFHQKKMKILKLLLDLMLKVLKELIK